MIFIPNVRYSDMFFKLLFKGERNLMKRISLVSLVGLALFIGWANQSGWADRATFDPTKGAVALPMSTPPTIDGILDFDNEQWDTAGGGKDGGSSNWCMRYDANAEDYLTGGDVSADEGPIEAGDCDVSIWAGFDADYLYIGVQVLDNDSWTANCKEGSANGNTWLDDSVEVFVDGDNSNYPTSDTTGTNPEVVGTGGQFVITALNAYREAEAGNPGFGLNKAWYAKTTFTDAGYEAEFRISMKTIGNPKQGDVIGFSVAVNDIDSGGSRQIIWCGKTHTEATYGNLFLGPHTYTAPKVSQAPTIDGKVSASEYGNAPTISSDNHSGVYDTSGRDDSTADGDLAYKAWVVHDSEAVYVGFDVTDDAVVTDTAAAGSEDGSTWNDDAVEIFFDANNDKEPVYTNSDLTNHPPFEGQYVLTPNGAHRDNEAGNPTYGESDDWYGLVSQTATGYQIEFKVTKSALLDPADGAVMGFNIAIDDDDSKASILQLLWQGHAHYEPSYGVLTLSATGTDVANWALF